MLAAFESARLSACLCDKCVAPAMVSVLCWTIMLNRPLLRNARCLACPQPMRYPQDLQQQQKSSSQARSTVLITLSKQARYCGQRMTEVKRVCEHLCLMNVRVPSLTRGLAVYMPCVRTRTCAGKVLVF